MCIKTWNVKIYSFIISVKVYNVSLDIVKKITDKLQDNHLDTYINLIRDLLPANTTKIRKP